MLLVSSTKDGKGGRLFESRQGFFPLPIPLFLLSVFGVSGLHTSRANMIGWCLRQAQKFFIGGINKKLLIPFMTTLIN
jgi:hypothetical protein